jgi:hypothetical protein
MLHRHQPDLPDRRSPMDWYSSVRDNPINQNLAGFTAGKWSNDSASFEFVNQRAARE